MRLQGPGKQDEGEDFIQHSQVRREMAERDTAPGAKGSLSTRQLSMAMCEASVFNAQAFEPVRKSLVYALPLSYTPSPMKTL